MSVFRLAVRYTFIMSTLSNVDTRRGGQNPLTPDLSPVSSPGNQELKTGVSVRFALDPNKQWYVLRVTYNRIIKAYELLKKDKVEIYIPMRHVQKMIHDKKKRVLEPLIPNIIFVYTTLEYITEFVKDNPENTFINFYLNHCKQDEFGKNPPLIVGYNEMMNFINITSADNDHIKVITPEQCHYKSGDVVRIIDGDFKGVTGRVARVSGQQRVVVELEGLCLIATAYIPSGFLVKKEE